MMALNYHKLVRYGQIPKSVSISIYGILIKTLPFNIFIIELRSIVTAIITPHVQLWKELWSKTNLGLIPAPSFISCVTMNLNLSPYFQIGIIKTNFAVFL
jgi:hypothetical protein